jgi:hypothetical protein
LGLSLLGVILPAISWAVFGSDLFDMDSLNWITDWIVSPTIGIVGLLCIYFCFDSAIQHNRSIFIGLLTGIFKMVFIAFSAFFILALLVGDSSDEDLSGSDAIFLILALASVLLITTAMINGPEVYEKRNQNVRFE